MTDWQIPEFTFADLRSVYTINLQKITNPLRKDVDPNPEIKYSYIEHDKYIFIFRYWVDWYTLDKMPVLQRAILNMLYGEGRLYSTGGTGKIVRREYMFIEFPYQRCLLATYLVPREENLFRQWGALEVQLTAFEAGKIVWRKFGYRIIPSEFLRLKHHYKVWCKEKQITADDINSDLQFPNDFLTSIRTFEMYKPL